MSERANSWKRMVRKYGSKPVLVDPRSTVRTQRSVTFCRPRRDKWAVACLLVPFSSAFVVVPAFMLMNAFQAQQAGSDSAAFLLLIPMLVGGLMLLLSLWIVTERNVISQKFGSSTLTIEYGAFGFCSRVELDLDPLEAELAEIPDWSQVSLMNVSLKHRERMDEEVRLASCSFRTWLLPLWRTLEELMPGRTCDQTLVEVKLPEGHTLSVSRYATWQNDRIYVFGLNVSTPEPHVMRFHRLSLDGGFFRLPASPRSITLTRHGQELEIFCESPGSILSRREERQVLSISDIAGIQI